MGRAAKRALRKIATKTRTDSDSDSSSESEDNADEQMIAPMESSGDVGDTAKNKRNTCLSLNGKVVALKSNKSDEDKDSGGSSDKDEEQNKEVLSDVEVVDLENEV